jgi:hypothetical protein
MSSFPEAINLLRGKSNRGQRDHRARSFSITLLAFVLVGSVFFYFVSWFSEVRRNRSDELVQAATIIVLKKLPPVVGNELVSILSNKGMEYQSAMRSEKKAVMEGGPPAVDSREMQIVIKKSLPPTEDDSALPETLSGDFHAHGTSYSELPKVENGDFSPAPEEPDPASPIDYVFKKRRLSL